MEPRGSSVSPLRMRRRITTSAPEQDHSRSGASIGRAECREKKIGIEPKGSFFFLTFPLIGHVTRRCGILLILKPAGVLAKGRFERKFSESVENRRRNAPT